MRSTKQTTLRIHAAPGLVLKTNDDLLYEWLTLGQHEGWSRTHDHAPNRTCLLIPKRTHPALAAKVLDFTPAELERTKGTGAAPLNVENATVLVELRRARREHNLPTFYTDQTPEDQALILPRISTAETMDLVATHGLDQAVRTLVLTSLPAREKLLQALGHSRVEEILSNYSNLPEELRWQIMRSSAFNAANIDVHAHDAVGLAGNPHLPEAEQLTVVQHLLTLTAAGDTQAIAPLSRALASPGLTEKVARAAANHLDELPHRAAVALAKNPTATWLWLRNALDRHTSPEVVAASGTVGEVGSTRLRTFKQHPDPAIRATLGGLTLPDAAWSAENPEHTELLRRIDDPLDEGSWTLELADMDPADWGAYSVARQWAARHQKYRAAEKQLAQLVDMHNRSWGTVGIGIGDPARAAKADSAKAVAAFNPLLAILRFEPGQTLTQETARLATVKAVAALAAEGEVPGEFAVVQAVLDAAAAEAHAA